MAILIDKNGNREEIPYYYLEQKFIEIISNSSNDIKEQFKIFKQDYKYFTPYFDFVVLHLGYAIENPMGYYNSLLVSIENKIYLLNNIRYNDYINQPELKNKILESRLIPFFIQCDDATLKISSAPEDNENFECGIIDRDNVFISLLNMPIHNNLALLIVNQMLIKHKDMYEKFVNYDSDFQKEIDFLEDELGYIRFGIMDGVMLTYRGSIISKKQLDYINYLKNKGWLNKDFTADKDEADAISKMQFKAKI